MTTPPNRAILDLIAHACYRSRDRKFTLCRRAAAASVHFRARTKACLEQKLEPLTISAPTAFLVKLGQALWQSQFERGLGRAAGVGDSSRSAIRQGRYRFAFTAISH
jgi:hypothetical protein